MVAVPEELPGLVLLNLVLDADEGLAFEIVGDVEDFGGFALHDVEGVAIDVEAESEFVVKPFGERLQVFPIGGLESVDIADENLVVTDVAYLFFEFFQLNLVLFVDCQILEHQQRICELSQSLLAGVARQVDQEVLVQQGHKIAKT